MNSSRSDWLPALFGALYLLVLFGSTFALYPVSENILVPHRDIYGMVSTIVGKLGYLSLIAVVAAVCARRVFRPNHMRSGSASTPLRFLLGCALVFLLGSTASVPFLVGFWSVCLVCAVRPSVIASAFSRRPSALCAVLAAVLLLCFAYFCVLLPFVTPVVASEGAQLVSMQNHYVLYTPGVVRALWGDAAPLGVLNYGLGSALFVELCSRLLAVVTRVDVVLVIKVVQVVFVVAVAALLQVLRPARSLYLWALVVLASPTLSLLSPILYYPNLTGIRFVPFLVALGALSFTVRSGKAHVELLAFVAALMVLYASESGLVASAAVFVFVLLEAINRSRSVRSGLLVGVRFVVVTACVLIGGALLESWGVQRVEGVQSSDTFFAAHIGGYCGLSELPNPFSTIVFFVGVYVLFRAASRVGRQRLGRWDAYQASIGVMMLGWLFYYVHRMHPYNLFFQGASLVFLIAPRCGPAVFRLMRGGLHSGAVTSVVITATFAALALDSIGRTVGELREHAARIAAAEEAPPLVSRMKLVAPYSTELDRQLSVLRSTVDRTRVLVLTNLSVEARLLGFNRTFPWYDPFIDVLTVRTRDSVVEWIDRHGPPILLVDDPGSALSRSVLFQTNQLQDIVSSLSTYRPAGGEAGWRRYERR